MHHLETLRDGERGGGGGGEDSNHWMSDAARTPGEDELLALLGFSYELLASVVGDSVVTLETNRAREEEAKRQLQDLIEEEIRLGEERHKERAALEEEDSFTHKLDSQGAKVGSHLASLSLLDSLQKVEGLYRSNNEPISSTTVSGLASEITAGVTSGNVDVIIESFPISITDFSGPDALAEALSSMHEVIQRNMTSASILMDRKDEHYRVVKMELADQFVEKRKREEGLFCYFCVCVDLLLLVFVCVCVCVGLYV